MKRNIIISIVLFFVFKNINIIIDSTLYSLDLFINKIFISVFPFMILGEVLFYYDYHIFIKNSFIGKFISKLFNIPNELSIIFILSLLTSSPNNAIYIKKMLDNKEINEETAEKLLVSSFFPSFSFTIGTVGILLFNDIKIGLILYISCILNNILIGLFVRKNNSIYIKHSTNNKDKLINTIKDSILNSINIST